MKQYTFAKLSKLGEFDEKYGQAYWGEPNEQLEPVKFNSMNQDITAEDKIEAEEVLLKTSTKGTEYHQLKKVRVVSGQVPQPHQETPSASTPNLETINQKLDNIIDMLIKLTEY